MKIHILGICGTLMGSIALLAKQLGHEVEGSDVNIYPPMSDQLAGADIIVKQGFLPQNLLPPPDLVIMGNAGLPRGNPAVEHVLENGLAFTSGAEWLGAHLLPGRWVIAIAGTHGKTTTTAMVSWILEYAGLNPGFLIGGVPGNFPVSARLGDSPFFVIEADEYDTSYFDRRSKFLHYRPRTAVLNNLEFDHADIFKDLEQIQQQFHLLVRTIPSSGRIILPAGDHNLSAVLDLGCWSETEQFNPEDSQGKQGWCWHLRAPGSSSFEVSFNGDPVGTIHWDLAGDHNRTNALAAIAAARHAGVPPKFALEALSSFKGVKRRMEIIYEDQRLTVFDDFAHHPTAIKTTLQGLRSDRPKAKILAVIEPGSHTMKLGIHENSLLPACDAADQVRWFQGDGVKWDMTKHLSDQRSAVTGNMEQLLALCLRDADQFDVIVIMSNSGFQGFHGKLVSGLQQARSNH